jgi:hypothetical protein
MPVNIGRRELIAAIGGAVAAWPLAARAQQSERVQRIGVLMSYLGSDPEAQAWYAAFREGLQKLGWTEGRNIRVRHCARPASNFPAKNGNPSLARTQSTGETPVQRWRGWIDQPHCVLMNAGLFSVCASPRSFHHLRSSIETDGESPC